MVNGGWLQVISSIRDSARDQYIRILLAPCSRFARQTRSVRQNTFEVTRSTHFHEFSSPNSFSSAKITPRGGVLCPLSNIFKKTTTRDSRITSYRAYRQTSHFGAPGTNNPLGICCRIGMSQAGPQMDPKWLTFETLDPHKKYSPVKTKRS